MFHLAEQQYDQRCVDPEFLKALFQEHARLPWLTRRHILSCEACQRACVEINETVPIQRRHFGKDFGRLIQLWFGTEETERTPGRFVSALIAGVKKYGPLLYVGALAIAVIGILKSIFGS